LCLKFFLKPSSSAGNLHTIPWIENPAFPALFFFFLKKKKIQKKKKKEQQEKLIFNPWIYIVTCSQKNKKYDILRYE